MLTRCRRPAHGDAGITLVELLVGMTLVTILGTIAMQFVLGSTKQTDRVTSASATAPNARTAIDRVASLIRLADSPTARPGTSTGRFEVITPTRIVFYANVSKTSRSGGLTRIPPTRVEISAAGATLTEKTYNPIVRYAAAASPTPTPAPTPYPSTYNYAGNYPTAPTTNRLLLSNLAVGAGGATLPVFTYYSSAAEAPLTPPTPTVPSGSPTPSPSVTVAATAVSSVAVVLTVVDTRGVKQVLRTNVAITGAVS